MTQHMRFNEAARAAPRVLIVTASDSRFIVFLRGLVASLAPVLAQENVELACFDIGLDPVDRRWLSGHARQISAPGTHLGVDPAQHGLALRSFLARPFLREYFPGYDVYVWIDSDIWLQDPGVVARYVAGALVQGMAITHEEERAYRFQFMLFGWTAKHFLLGYGPWKAAWLLMHPHVNAGFFALSANAPQWEGWAKRYAAAIRRTGAVVPHDQFSLNHALHAQEGKRAPAQLLDPVCNWICARGTPMWNDAAGCYCAPYAPYAPIAAMHLAGPAKRQLFQVRRTNGGSFQTYLLHGSSPESPVLELPEYFVGYGVGAADGSLAGAAAKGAA